MFLFLFKALCVMSGAWKAPRKVAIRESALEGYHHTQRTRGAITESPSAEGQ